LFRIGGCIIRPLERSVLGRSGEQHRPHFETPLRVVKPMSIDRLQRVAGVDIGNSTLLVNSMANLPQPDTPNALRGGG